MGIPVLGLLDHIVACAPGQSTWLRELLPLSPSTGVLGLPSPTPSQKWSLGEVVSEFSGGMDKSPASSHACTILPGPEKSETIRGTSLSAHMPSHLPGTFTEQLLNTRP